MFRDEGYLSDDSSTKEYFTSPTHEYFGASTSSTEAAAMYLSDIAKQEKFLNLEKKEKLSKVAKQAVINDDPCLLDLILSEICVVKYSSFPPRTFHFIDNSDLYSLLQSAVNHESIGVVEYLLKYGSLPREILENYINNKINTVVAIQKTLNSDCIDIIIQKSSQFALHLLKSYLITHSSLSELKMLINLAGACMSRNDQNNFLQYCYKSQLSSYHELCQELNNAVVPTPELLSKIVEFKKYNQYIAQFGFTIHLQQINFSLEELTNEAMKTTKGHDDVLIRDVQDQYAFFGYKNRQWALHRIESATLPMELKKRDSFVGDYFLSCTDLLFSQFSKYHTPFLQLSDSLDDKINERIKAFDSQLKFLTPELIKQFHKFKARMIRYHKSNFNHSFDELEDKICEQANTHKKKIDQLIESVINEISEQSIPKSSCLLFGKSAQVSVFKKLLHDIQETVINQEEKMLTSQRLDILLKKLSYRYRSERYTSPTAFILAKMIMRFAAAGIIKYSVIECLCERGPMLDLKNLSLSERSQALLPYIDKIENEQPRSSANCTHGPRLLKNNGD